MVIITQFDIGDTVSLGSIHEAKIMGINFRQGVMYAITYWDDNRAIDYVAYDWEITLVEKANKE